jgi:RNA-directed DNA polymerase
VIRGHNNYYGVPMNTSALAAFRWAVTRLWRHSLRRRSQKHRLTWQRMSRFIRRWFLPSASAIHIPGTVCASPPEARAGCGKAARPDPWRGQRVIAVPTPTTNSTC